MEKKVIASMGLGFFMLQPAPIALAQTKYEIVDNAEKSVKVIKGSEKETVLVIEEEVKFSISRSPSINKSQPPLKNNNIPVENDDGTMTLAELEIEFF